MTTTILDHADSASTDHGVDVTGQSIGTTGERRVHVKKEEE
jgi:hypothetical protein